VRIDRHAADGIENRVSRVVLMPARARLHDIIHWPAFALETDTLRGYIAVMQAEAKTSVLNRLQRIEGQARGLSRMVEEDRYCIDIVTQISAVRAALRRVEEEILRDHVAHCVEHAIASGDQADQRRKVSELIDVLSRTHR